MAIQEDATPETTAEQSTIPGLRDERRSLGRTLVSWITTTDHKVIGHLYPITSFVFFCVGGLLAILIRAALFGPGAATLAILCRAGRAARGAPIAASAEQYTPRFTMHGTIMLLLFAAPLLVGLGNALVPPQTGAPDVAFPRLNMFAYWLFLFAGLMAVAG